jgi:hypothetical protein
VPAQNHVSAEAPGQAQDVTIVDLSVGGFLLESDAPFTVGSLHQFRIAQRGGAWTPMLTARSMHVRVRRDSSPVRYLTGFAFVEPIGEEARRRVHALVEHVTSVVVF